MLADQQARIMKLLDSIDSGLIKIICLDEDSAAYMGNTKFITENKYLIGVFNDCGNFDYIDFIISPSNDLLFYYARDCKQIPLVGDYYPSEYSEKINWHMNRGIVDDN